MESFPIQAKWPRTLFRCWGKICRIRIRRRSSRFGFMAIRRWPSVSFLHTRTIRGQNGRSLATSSRNSLRAPFIRFLAPRECGDFVAVAAKRHRTPTAAMRPRSVVKNQAARGICTQPNPRGLAFRNNLRRGSRNCGEQPVETALSCDVLDTPGLCRFNQFVVAFGYLQHGIYWLHVLFWNALTMREVAKRQPQAVAKSRGSVQ